MHKILSLFMLGSVILFSATAYSGDKVQWSYSGKTGPEHWGSLDKSFDMCSKGKNQSPINLTNFIEADLKPITFGYHSSAKLILNNGHTVQANFEKGSTITIDDISFSLVQIHFHAPSENHINGKSFPMEAHAVHADKDGNLAVIAVMFETGKANPLLETLWAHLPKKKGDQHILPKGTNADGLLPKKRDYYRFNGSLTTPPGTEGVRWLVMKKTVSASAEQIKIFEQAIGHPNNRPIQPTNARPILK